MPTQVKRQVRNWLRNLTGAILAASAIGMSATGLIGCGGGGGRPNLSMVHYSVMQNTNTLIGHEDKVVSVAFPQMDAR